MRRLSLRQSGSGRRAVELCPDDIWAGHAVAHVCEMEDRIEDGLRWLDEASGGWKGANNFAFHVAWHRCLFLLDLGRDDEALALYDRDVRPESSDELLDITNAVSLLWRLEQLGVDVGGRWEELAIRSAKRGEDHMLAFGDVHYAMALAAAGDEGFARWRQSSEIYAATPETESAVMREIGSRSAMLRRRIAAGTIHARLRCFCRCARAFAESAAAMRSAICSRSC